MGCIPIILGSEMNPIDGDFSGLIWSIAGLLAPFSRGLSEKGESI